MPDPVTQLGIDEAELQRLGALWTAREIEQQPEMLRQTQSLLSAQKDAIEAFLKPLLDRRVRIILTGAGRAFCSGVVC